MNKGTNSLKDRLVFTGSHTRKLGGRQKRVSMKDFAFEEGDVLYFFVCPDGQNNKYKVFPDVGVFERYCKENFPGISIEKIFPLLKKIPVDKSGRICLPKGFEGEEIYIQGYGYYFEITDKEFDERKYIVSLQKKIQKKALKATA